MSPIAIIDPPQPAGAGEYSINQLTPSYIKEYQNNADYTQKTGQTAPPYNPAFPVKRWADTSVKPGVFALFTYNTIHLDPSFQKAVVTPIAVPGFLAMTVNMPPDSGPQPASVAGEFLVPKRALLPNEVLYAWPFGINVRNTDIYQQPAAPTAGGGFTEADRGVLNAIAAVVVGIK